MLGGANHGRGDDGTIPEWVGMCMHVRPHPSMHMPPSMPMYMHMHVFSGNVGREQQKNTTTTASRHEWMTLKNNRQEVGRRRTGQVDQRTRTSMHRVRHPHGIHKVLVLWLVVHMAGSPSCMTLRTHKHRVKGEERVTTHTNTGSRGKKEWPHAQTHRSKGEERVTTPGNRDWTAH